LYIGVVIVTLLLGMPFFWMVATSLKSSAEAMAAPPSWWPAEWRFLNYRDAWNAAPFGRFYVNSIVTGAATTALQLAFAALMAYAFAFIRFPAKRALLIAVLATMMIPEEMKLVPNYLTLSSLGWIDTYWALIVPPIAHAFPVFVLYQYFRTFPPALVDAAKADGAGHFRILTQVVLPTGRPVLVAVALVSFLGRWNDYLWPLVVTNSPAMRTLPVGLAYLKKQAEEGATPWNLLMAGAVLVVLPILVLYTLVQRQFVEGLTRGAIKG
jgi:multiple sugar transport system permease protein/sn-glycerol 3-phosphate transport system permease protein